MPVIRIGTSGWSYRDWVGPFYPKGTRPSDYLRLYAEHFDIVEVDSTHYRTPLPSVVRGWAEKTPDDFRFALKMVRTVTHEKVLLDCQAECDEFLEAVGPLGPKLHSILLQFGYFNRSVLMGLEPFLERLGSFLEKFRPPCPVAVEIRNKGWLQPEFFDLLTRYHIAFAACDHAWMPPIDRVLAEHNVATGPFLFLRLIGDRKGMEQITSSWDRQVVDRSERLKSLAAALGRLPAGMEVAAFVNNHYAGHAPATCRQLGRLFPGR
ncbi:MAG: DUF72 domain-containing protein [Phycisphaerales bacterium]|nr:MAG: DUF72 domain-containing protein [Phycisphaerales bacterium]